VQGQEGSLPETKIHSMPTFFSRFLGGNQDPTPRTFAYFDECPKICVRFNEGKEYGPTNLRDFVTWESFNATDVVEGRFEDEKAWKPKAYFVELCETIPPSLQTPAKLEKEQIPYSPGLSHKQALAMLAEVKASKPPTKAQLKQIADFGYAIDEVKTWGHAQYAIDEIKKQKQAEQAKADAATQRELDSQEIEECNKQLDELALRIRAFFPDWKPKA